MGYNVAKPGTGSGAMNHIVGEDWLYWTPASSSAAP